MTLNIKIPNRAVLKPSITVFGTGGAGGNAVNNMIAQSLEGINFVIANTDAQAMENSLAPHRIQLGATITQGLGAGSYPEVGRASAEEAQDEILDAIRGANMLFITAGMGGGTGTGAAPVIARLAHEQGILTVAVVTKPFHFEGTHRMRVAEAGLSELQKHVDTLIVIPNQNLFRVVDKSTTFADAFKMADNVLMAGVRGVTDLMMMPGLINLDFADVRSVMSEMGRAMMGTGEATGENRANQAAEAAISNPLLDNASMKGARGVLINITGGADMTLFEVDEAANRIREEVDPEANIIFGSTFNPELEGTIRVSVVATGIDQETGTVRATPGLSVSPSANLANRAATATPAAAPQAPSVRISEPAPAQTATAPSVTINIAGQRPQTSMQPAAPALQPQASQPAQEQKPVASIVDPSYYAQQPQAEKPAEQHASVAQYKQPEAEKPVAPWLKTQETAAQAQKPAPKAKGGLFNKIAALAGFMEEEPLYRPATGVHVSHQHYGQQPAQGTAASTAQIRPAAAESAAQPSFGDDLLDTPAYLRRRAK